MSFSSDSQQESESSYFLKRLIPLIVALLHLGLTVPVSQRAQLNGMQPLLMSLVTPVYIEQSVCGSVSRAHNKIQQMCCLWYLEIALQFSWQPPRAPSQNSLLSFSLSVGLYLFVTDALRQLLEGFWKPCCHVASTHLRQCAYCKYQKKNMYKYDRDKSQLCFSRLISSTCRVFLSYI